MMGGALPLVWGQRCSATPASAGQRHEGGFRDLHPAFGREAQAASAMAAESQPRTVSRPITIAAVGAFAGILLHG